MEGVIESGKKIVLDIANPDITLVECPIVRDLIYETIEYLPKDNVTINKVVDGDQMIWAGKG